MLQRLLEYDRELFLYLNSLGVERFDFFWSTITNIWVWLPLYLLIIYLIFSSYAKRNAFRIVGMLMLLIFVTSSLTEAVKNFVGRIRPVNDPEINTLIRILHTPENYSFFSGHASNSFAATTFVFLFLHKKYKWSFLWYLWPLLFSLSRIYIGVHYPSDIIVGMLAGIVLGCTFHFLTAKRLLDPTQS